MIFFFFTTSQKKELRKSFRPFFGPFWQIVDKNSATNLLGRTYFLAAPFELCGRKFSQLATLAVETLAGSRVFPTPPLPGRHQLLLAGVGRTQPIRMEEAYTHTYTHTTLRQ
jgi:hypothetical protein